MPSRKLQTALGMTSIKGIVIAAEKAGEASRIGDDVKAMLRKRHGMGASGPTKSAFPAQGGGAVDVSPSPPRRRRR